MSNRNGFSRSEMPCCADTLLRRIRASSRPEDASVRVLGADDWALRRGQRYGTIMCDLEKRQVIDLLPDRTSNPLADWLVSHPGVEIISRDRGGEYAKGRLKAHRRHVRSQIENADYTTSDQAMLI